MSDGALIVIDVAEGVSAQTVTVLRQAWIERLQPCLVLNKIDRLITELKMTPAEAYAHMQQILEAVNAVTGTFYAGEIVARLDQQNDDVRFCGDAYTVTYQQQVNASADPSAGVEFEDFARVCSVYLIALVA